MDTPPVTLSVIICSYNRAILLEKCLESLLKQNPIGVEHEIIVVDNNSNDNTNLIVDSYASRLKNIHYVVEPHQGLSNARNRGWQEAGGDYLIYLDDDAIAPPEYLSNILEVVRANAPDIMGGPVYPYYSSPKPRWFRDEFETRKYEDQSGFSRKCGISGGNFVIRRKVLEQLGMFDSRFGMRYGSMGMMEERKVVELYRARIPPAEQKVYYSLECFIYHYAPAYKLKLSYMMKRAWASGYADFFMILDVEESPNHKKGIQKFMNGFYAPLYRMREQAQEIGWRRVDYSKQIIGGLLNIFAGMGYLWAQLKYLFGYRRMK